MENSKQEKKWKELEAIQDVKKRIDIIYRDTKLKRRKFKSITESDPYRMFHLLGGNLKNIISHRNYAPKYTYEDYLERYWEDYNEKDAKKWNVKKESIKNAIDLGFYYVTGLCELSGTRKRKIYFEYMFNEGEPYSIIGTPYNSERVGDQYGIEFS